VQVQFSAISIFTRSYVVGSIKHKYTVQCSDVRNGQYKVIQGHMTISTPIESVFV